MASSEAAIRKCVHCGFCLATCPTYALLGDERDSPRGRIYLIKTMLETEAVPSPPVVTHVDRCLSCLSCMTTCPSGVDYRRLVDHARTYIEAHGVRPWRERLFRRILVELLPHQGRLRAALALARLARPLRPALAAAPGFATIAALLSLAPPRAAPPAPKPAPGGGGRRRVMLLQGCVEPAVRPAIRAAAIRVLERLGFTVTLARREGCCGALAHHLGREDAALAAARRNVDAWSVEIDRGGVEAILVTASGCGSMIKDYGHMLRSEPAYAARAAAASALCQDISQFLADASLSPRPPSGRVVAYHASCALQHGQGVVRAPERLLADAGYAVRTPADAHLCCGSAGVYNILEPAIANDLGVRKAAALEALRPDVIGAGNIGCALQIAGRASTPVVHVVELVDWAHGGPPPEGCEDL